MLGLLVVINELRIRPTSLLRNKKATCELLLATDAAADAAAAAAGKKQG